MTKRHPAAPTRQPADDAAPARKSRDQNQATGRVLSVLSAFVSSSGPWGVTELSQQLGMTKNMTHRALTTLVEQGYLVRDESGTRYELGYRIVELQNPHVPEPDLRSLCAPAGRDFFRITGETVSVSVRRGDNVVFIDSFETRHPGAWRIEIGDLRPLHSTASSRVVLAFLTDAEIKDYIDRHGPLHGGDRNPSLTPEQLWEDIRTIRATGFAINYRTAPPHMVAVAFPILDPDNRVKGAIAVGGPVERFDQKLKSVLPELQKIAARLNERTRLYPFVSTATM